MSLALKQTHKKCELTLAAGYLNVKVQIVKMGGSVNKQEERSIEKVTSSIE